MLGGYSWIEDGSFDVIVDLLCCSVISLMVFIDCFKGVFEDLIV